MVKILSCVPKQLRSTEEKLDWLSSVAKKNRPDIFVTPQEFFGGAVMMPHKKFFKREELLPILQKLCKRFNMALVVGLVEKDDDGRCREVIWFLDRDGTFKGRVCKFALPRYDHVDTHGFGNIVPETDFSNRFQAFEIAGLRVSAMFCWEVFSDVLWTGLGLVEPDVVFSMIKFGVNAWPSVTKIKGLATVTGFGYGGWLEEGRWIERLYVACRWQVRCPIICSTNSWDLRPISMPLCGMVSAFADQAPDTLWHPKREDGLKTIPERIQVDELNPAAVRCVRENKFKFKQEVGVWPSYDLMKYTMALKIARIEKRIIRGQEFKQSTAGSAVGFNL